MLWTLLMMQRKQKITIVENRDVVVIALDETILSYWMLVVLLNSNHAIKRVFKYEPFLELTIASFL